MRPPVAEPAALADLARNRLLASLDPADLAQLAPAALRIAVPRGAALYETGGPADSVSFPLCGAVLSLSVAADGGAIEAALIGPEGAAGGIISLGAAPAFARVVVQTPGEIVRIDTAAIAAAAAGSPALRDRLSRYADCLVAELLQNVACNAAHALESRIARWLLSARDRAGCADLHLTHDYLARLLGVGRTYVTRSAGELQRRSLIRYHRGQITIADPCGLAAVACDCRDAIRRHFARVLPGVHPAESNDWE